MILHLHGSYVPNSGDVKRIRNIDQEFADLLNEDTIEVSFYWTKVIKLIKKVGKFKLRKETKKKFYIYQPPKTQYYFPAYQAFVMSILGLIYKPSVVVCEMRFPNKFREVFKFFCPDTKIIADIHGAALEERMYQTPDLPIKEQERIFKYESYFMEKADHILCQSSEMKRYILKTYKTREEDITVYRCGYDSSMFYVNESSRNEMRKELGIKANERLFVYAGSLHKWQKIEETLNVFTTYHRENSNSKILILTAEQQTLKELLARPDYTDIIDSVISFSVPFADVPKYLNSADVAFLLRDNHTMNAVASPTKLAEYMACGLPIITSEVAKCWVAPEGEKYLILDNMISSCEDIDNVINSNNKAEEETYAKANLSLEIDHKCFMNEIGAFLKR